MMQRHPGRKGKGLGRRMMKHLMKAHGSHHRHQCHYDHVPRPGGNSPGISEDAEEVLERLWVECEEKGADALDAGAISHEEHMVIRETVELLIGKGLVKERRDGKDEPGDRLMITLTENGKSAARSVVRRHRLAERLLHDVLNVYGEDMEGSACKLEHALTPESEESICTLLGHPPECPHGRPIPEGRCCVEGRKEAGRLMFTAAELRKGQSGKIRFLNTRDSDKLQKLIAMGILPGLDVEVIAHYPTHVLKIGESQFALDEKMASNIYVKVHDS